MAIAECAIALLYISRCFSQRGGINKLRRVKYD